MVSTIAGALSQKSRENPCRDSEGSRKEKTKRHRKKATKVCKEELDHSSLSGSWVFVPRRTKDEETTPTPETRSVLPRGLVIQQNMTKLASIETRPLQQCWSIQGKYWLELQRLQHHIQQIIVQTLDPNRKLPDRAPIAALEELRDRINSISLDTNALNSSCTVAKQTSREASSSCVAPPSRWFCLRREAETRQHQWTRRRSEKRACSDNVEESSSVEEVDARRKHNRSFRKSQYSYLTHLQSDTSLRSHITTPSTHGLCSNGGVAPRARSLPLHHLPQLRAQTWGLS